MSKQVNLNHGYVRKKGKVNTVSVDQSRTCDPTFRRIHQAEQECTVCKSASNPLDEELSSMSLVPGKSSLDRLKQLLKKIA